MKKNTIYWQLMGKISAFFLRKIACAPNTKTISPVSDQISARISQWVIDKKWAENLTMKEVADSLGISREELGVYSWALWGMNFLQWRKKTRIEEAKRLLLEHRDTPTSLIGEQVGISDKSNFRKQFKETAGCTPAEWRLKN
ncbi:MAG: AraC family transcriptional regulator [Bacteroidales bacterium]|nr:AraC family transcriptional regulator [Bacteroidales bacterium]